jgi:hypothetical protein
MFSAEATQVSRLLIASRAAGGDEAPLPASDKLVALLTVVNSASIVPQEQLNSGQQVTVVVAI